MRGAWVWFCVGGVMREAIHGLLRELDRSGCRPVVVAGHPRSGTHLLIDTLRLNFPRCASWKRPLERMDRLYLDLSGEGGTIRPEIVRDVLTRVERPLIKAHALPDFQTEVLVERPLQLEPELIDWLRCNATFVYVYRDGREAICSTYAALYRSGGLSLGDFMLQQQHGMSRPRLWAHHVQAWLEDSRVYALAMRELLRQGAAVFPHIAEKLGFCWRSGAIPALPPICGPGLLPRLRRRIVRRPRSTAAVAGRPVLDWRMAFTPADREFFHQEAGQMLIKLGYEDSDLWTDPRHDGDPRCPALFGLQPVRAPIYTPMPCSRPYSARFAFAE